MKHIPTIKVFRHWQDDKQTLGTCTVLDPKDQPIFASLSLERGWQDNKNSISCYPIGIYRVVYEWSERYECMLWEVKGVENRSECKFHSANHWHELEGCTALGTRPKDIDNDGYIDITSSRNIMKDFHKALDGFTEALLIVKGKPGIC